MMIIVFSNANFHMARGSGMLAALMEAAVHKYSGKGFNSLGTVYTVSDPVSGSKEPGSGALYL